MILFDETESKYYELIAYLLSEGGSLTHNDIACMIEQCCPGETDFEVTEALFSNTEGEEMIYIKEDDEFVPALDSAFPVRNNKIELETTASLVNSPYVNHFLSAKTIEKLRKATATIAADWSPNDITVKNTFLGGAASSIKSYSSIISSIAKAIREKKGIQYDYIRPGRMLKNNAVVFPVKIEFSLVNDRFRVCGYNEDEKRYVKMNLDSMQNIMLLDKHPDIDVTEGYSEFIHHETKKILLDVDPVPHVIERCFRVFSYYDRKARYDKTGNKYRLGISYLKADENEVIKNILSMGSYVVVLEPRTIQREVYNRIQAASKLYE
ncbi:WYL domain-containing protein [Butyrivibrio sp. VCD2006]|uniref:WYL domain-containing protein n=1 Tax=Butyrivibrio sp. VCD2006 TaxID=1280664 RepID=UPI0004192A0E|nr:WYL domain-containing protein [Butyrivibrio sp. VCD2006]